MHIFYYIIVILLFHIFKSFKNVWKFKIIYKCIKIAYICQINFPIAKDFNYMYTNILIITLNVIENILLIFGV